MAYTISLFLTISLLASVGFGQSQKPVSNPVPVPAAPPPPPLITTPAATATTVPPPIGMPSNAQQAKPGMPQPPPSATLPSLPMATTSATPAPIDTSPNADLIGGATSEPAFDDNVELRAEITVSYPDEKRPEHLLTGSMTFRLMPREAPKTVSNFVDLVEGHKAFIDLRRGAKLTRPFYNGMRFHRVLRGKLIQTGDLAGDGRGGPGYSIPHEYDRRGNQIGPGAMVMVDDGEQDSGSQFFITDDDMDGFLDQQNTMFGEMISGRALLDHLAHVKTDVMDRPVKPVIIKNIRIIRLSKNRHTH